MLRSRIHQESFAHPRCQGKEKRGIIVTCIKNGLFFSQFDIRIYVLITGLDPLKIYMYDDGLVRIATEDYTEDPAFISDSCIHVCNYDVNHQSEKFINNTHESSRDGHKVHF